MHDLGDTVTLRFEVRDLTGVLTNAASTAVTLNLPDGTVNTSLTLSTVSTGVYELSYVPLVAGRYVVHVAATAPTAAISDQFDVRPAAPAYLVSLADAKARLNIDPTDYTFDEELRQLIEAATIAVERHLRQVVARRTVVETVEVLPQWAGLCHWTGVAWLSYTPALSVTSVVSLDGLTSWPVGNLMLSGSQLWAAAGLGLAGDVVVTYVAGYAVVPANYSQAALEIVAHLATPQRLSSLGPRPFSSVGAAGEEDLAGLAGLGFALPNRALELLGSRPPLVG